MDKLKFVHFVLHPTPHMVPDSKVHGANMGLIWGWQDPGGPDVGPMNFAIWGEYVLTMKSRIFSW